MSVQGGVGQPRWFEIQQSYLCGHGLSAPLEWLDPKQERFIDEFGDQANALLRNSETAPATRHNRTVYDYDFRKDHLNWHIHYHLGADEKRALAKFAELLRQHGRGPVHEPRFVV